MSAAKKNSMIISGSTFSPESDVKYAKPKINKSGGKAIGILNAHSDSILNLNTPLMKTWGVNEWIDEQSGKKAYDFVLQFNSEDYQSDAERNFLNGLKEFENKIKDDAVKNCKEWFNKSKMSLEVVEALFNPVLKYPKNPDTGEADMSRSPTFKIKLNYWDDKFDGTELYDMNKSMIFPDESGTSTPADHITKGSHTAVVVRCGGLWFANGKFGVTWKLVQAIVKPRQSLAGRCHIELSVEEREVLNEQQSDNEEDIVVDKKVTDDTDEEDNNVEAEVEAEVEAAAVEPPKKVVKKKVTKKKVVKEDA